MKRLLTIFKIYSAVYWGIYIINVFYYWELYNPFWWIIEMPFNQDIRHFILVSLPMIIIMSLFMYYVGLDKSGRFVTPNLIEDAK